MPELAVRDLTAGDTFTTDHGTLIEVVNANPHILRGMRVLDVRYRADPDANWTTDWWTLPDATPVTHPVHVPRTVHVNCLLCKGPQPCLTDYATGGKVLGVICQDCDRKVTARVMRQLGQ